MKDGWKTSEFWVSLAGMGVMIAQSFGVEVDNEAAVAGVAALYALGRSLVKAFGG